MLFALIPVAVLASLDQTQAVGVGVTVLCAIYVAGFAYSWGPVVWVVCAEVSPSCSSFVLAFSLYYFVLGPEKSRL